jgi:hypothetical protein
VRGSAGRERRSGEGQHGGLHHRARRGRVAHLVPAPKGLLLPVSEL